MALRPLVWLAKVPPMWFGRFTFAALVVAILCSGWAMWAMNQAAKREGEALWMRDVAVQVLDSLRVLRCVPYHDGDHVVIYRGTK